MGISQNISVNTRKNPIKGEGIWSIEVCDVQISCELTKCFNDSIIAKIFMCDLSLKRGSFYSLIRLFLALILSQL